MVGSAYDFAWSYRRRGWSPIDVPYRSKNPAREGWQNERLTDAEIESRFRDQQKNVSVLLGDASSSLNDIDCDIPEARVTAAIIMPRTEAVFGRAGAPRSHLLFYTTSPVATTRYQDPTKGADEDRSTILEVRSTGAHTLFPGSVHPSGEDIVWFNDGEPAVLAGEDLMQLAGRSAAAALLARHWPGHGSRQDAALALAGGLLRAEMDSEVAAEFIRAVATAAGDEETPKRMTASDFTAARLGGGMSATGWPKLTELMGAPVVQKVKEWLGINERSQRASASTTAGKPSQADDLVELGKTCELFHDSRSMGFAQFEVGDHLETWPLSGKGFKSWLRRTYYQTSGKVPSSEAVAAAIGTLEGVACFDGPEYELGNRVHLTGETIYYDLADKGWRVIAIDAEGWRVQRPDAPTFRRYAHQLAQIEPVPRGDPWALFNFLNVKREHRLLMLVWLITTFVPDMPHPVLDFHGEKGAGKSVGQRVLRDIVDPSAAPSLVFPRDTAELAQQLAHNYAPIYDNLSSLPAWLSDCICRAVSGDGFSKRELYSNDDDVIFAYRRVIMLNGINVAPWRPDLLDRTILIGLERILRGARRDERTFWREFKAAKPAILGGIFDVLSRALVIVEEINFVEGLERMADFTRWGAAIAVALGEPQEAFLEAYRENIGAQNREALEGDLVGNAILRMMTERQAWFGTPTQLLMDLESVAWKAHLIQRTASGKVDTKSWPGAPHILSRRLNLIRSNLADMGIAIRESRDAERTIEIERLESPESSVGSVGSDAEAEDFGGDDGTDATDATSQPSVKVVL